MRYAIIPIEKKAMPVGRMRVQDAEAGGLLGLGIRIRTNGDDSFAMRDGAYVEGVIDRYDDGEFGAFGTPSNMRITGTMYTRSSPPHPVSWFVSLHPEPTEEVWVELL